MMKNGPYDPVGAVREPPMQSLCARNRLCLFGDIVNAEMQSNDFGIMVADS